MNQNELREQIEAKRAELNKLASQYGSFLEKKVLEKSIELDQLLNAYQCKK